MSTTEIAVLPYNATPILTRCGEVYCSENLDNFLIHCGTCSEEFYLLSCTLFIKHIKQCKTMGFENNEQENMTSLDVCNYTNDNLHSDSLKSSIINSEEAGTEHVDPLKMSFKIEIIKENEEGFNESLQDTEFLSDYMDEEDLSIDKVMCRNKIEDIIYEYKKHPILWDPELARSSTNSEKEQHYKQITKSVNTKFKTNLSVQELYHQILELRQMYKNVLTRKQKHTEGNTNFNPKLWYFEQFSFIQGLNDDIEVELPSMDDTDSNTFPKQEPFYSESSDSEIDQSIQSDKAENNHCKILNDPNIISAIIAQYKQYPFLWDQTAPLYNSKYARMDAYRKIAVYINKKFNKHVTDKNVRQQIATLRSGYRRIQRKRKYPNYQINLWYFDDLSFIDRKSNHEENNAIPIEVDVSETSNDQANSIIENQPYEKDKVKGETSAQRRETEIVFAIIAEYKKHPCLYNNFFYKTNCRFSRADGFNKIRTNINNKFNTNYTDAEIKTKICQLRSSYRRILRTKEQFENLHANANRKFHPQWKYFEKLSFIGTKDIDFSVRHRKYETKQQNQGKENEQEKPIKKEAEENQNDELQDQDNNDDFENDCDYENKKYETLHHDDIISMDSDDKEPSQNCLEIECLPEYQDKLDQESCNEEDRCENPQSILKNKELLTAIIEEYQKLPCLWDIKQYTTNKTYRKEAFEKMAKNINAQFNTKYNYKDMSSEIVKLRATYKRTLKKKQEDPNFEPKLWYVEKLYFIEGQTTTQDNDQEEDFAMFSESNEASCQANESAKEDKKQEIFNRKHKVKSKDMVLDIIDLYKTAPILWDTNHPLHMLRTERRKAIQQITELLGREHGFDLTVEEFRYQIRFLRDSYFRALRQENAAKTDNFESPYIPKPFFFDRISFLEPFADKFPTTGQKSNSDAPDPNKDFNYLLKNKPLMIDFIEAYKAHPCLWNPKDKDKENVTAHSEAYDEIIKMFLEYDVILSKEQILSAIRFLHISYVKQQKNNDKNLATNTTSEPIIWFYDNLFFLGKTSKHTNKYCSHCDQHFHTLASFERHTIEIAGEYPYKCSICNARFISRSKYAYHQYTHKEPHKCDLCGFQAYDKHNYNVHMRRHKGIHPFKCPECGKGFVTSTELNRHMRMHTGERPFICDICGKTMPANSEFRQHMKRHTNQRDHKCDLCGHAFFTPKTLRDHMASHSSERKHVCETCGAAFKRKKTLHQHKALHAEKKKHECKICGKMFAQKAGVYSHMKSHDLMPTS